MVHWIARGAVLAIGSWYVLRSLLSLIVAIREGARVDFPFALNLLIGAAFGLLLAVSGATGNVNFAWAAAVVGAFGLVVAGVGRLLGPPEPS